MKRYSCCEGHQFDDEDVKEIYQGRSVCPFCWPDGFGVYLHRESSKREDFVYNFTILERALKRAVREGAWDQEEYDEMLKLVKDTKMRYSELRE